MLDVVIKRSEWMRGNPGNYCRSTNVVWWIEENMGCATGHIGKACGIEPQDMDNRVYIPSAYNQKVIERLDLDEEYIDGVMDEIIQANDTGIYETLHGREEKIIELGHKINVNFSFVD